MTAVFKKELKMYFTSFFAYFYYALFFLVLGVFFVVNCLSTYSTQFGYYVLSRGFLVIVMLLPFCTMRLFAQEKRSKTDQLLFTAPVSAFSVLLGKYLATMVFILIPVLCSLLYPILISGQGEMSVRFLAGTYIATVLVTLVLLSVGLFLSSLTSNVVLAAAVTYGFYAVVLLGRIIEGITNTETFYYIIHNTSLYNKYYDMMSGIVRSGDIIYLLSLIVGFFLLTWLVLEKRRLGSKGMAIGMVFVILLAALISGTAFHFTKVYDFTAEGLLTLSKETEETVKNISKPTDIYYIGARSRANATYQELFNEYARLNENLKFHYKNVETDSAFREKYLYNVSQITETSILVVCDERYIYLDSEDYISTVQTSQYSRKSTLEIENQLTSAIYYTNSEEINKICTVTGHGEETLNSDFTNLLLLNNYEMEELNLDEIANSIDTTIPEDCEAILMNAPQVDYSEESLKVLKEYLEDGGRLFVSIDPLNEEVEHLFSFLNEYGLDLNQGVIIENEDENYVYDTAYYLMPKIQNTEVTKFLLENNMRVLTMTSKGIVKEGKANGYTCTDILTTSGKAFSKVTDFENMTSKGEDDIGGPFSVAALAQNPEKGMVFLITSNIFFNEEVDADSAGANRRFFLSVMDELTGNDTGSLAAGKEVGNQVALYPNTLQNMLKIITIVIIPVLIAVIGIAVMVVRYRYMFFSLFRKRKENAYDEK
ncbi:MAG: ABC transporter permease [Lachnospiraceae bacterium]|nr:ABC transporter permease [Lachnospiraceae bacterium]